AHAQAWHQDFASNRPQILGDGAASRRHFGSALGYVCSESRQGDRRVRLLYFRHRHVPRIRRESISIATKTYTILHFNVTEHPSADWTIQQFRKVLAEPHPYSFVIRGTHSFLFG